MARADCPKCGGTGWVTVDMSGGGLAGGAPTPAAAGKRVPVAVHEAALCDCTDEGRDERLITAARLPKRYAACDFESFDTNQYHTDINGPEAARWNESLQQARLVTQGFARDYPMAAECGLLLMGPCGTGKTHLAVAALRALIERGHTGLFYDYRELLKQIQDSYNPANQATEMAVLDPVLRTEVLLLDDLGASKPSDWALETVGHILTTRYNEKRVTLITTNYLDAPNPLPPGLQAPAWADSARPGSPPMPTSRSARLPSGQSVAAARVEDTLTDRVGQRIRSRLYEMCRTVEIVAPDYRKEIRQARS